MPRRAITPGTQAPSGEKVAMEDMGANYTLWLPAQWNVVPTNSWRINVHFHGTEWFIIQEHERAGYRRPLVVFQSGEGSSAYRRLLEDTNRFARVLKQVEAELHRRGAPAGARIDAVDVSSFSAGYGAVRELVKCPEYRSVVRRIVLADSMYAGLAPVTNSDAGRQPDPRHIAPWLAFAREAMQGRTTFVFTHSAVPTGAFASSAECAGALLAALGVPTPRPVPPASSAAARVPDYPLETQCDVGRFHVWGYGGQDAQAHLTHIRHLADIWRALDEASE